MFFRIVPSCKWSSSRAIMREALLERLTRHCLGKYFRGAAKQRARQKWKFVDSQMQEAGSKYPSQSRSASLSPSATISVAISISLSLTLSLSPSLFIPTYTDIHALLYVFICVYRYIYIYIYVMYIYTHINFYVDTTLVSTEKY